MLTVQSTSLAVIEKRVRHPDILKYKIAFIENNKELFEFLFITDWRAWDWSGSKRHSMKGRMPPKKTDWSVAALEMGNVLKQMFNYNSMSDPKSIMYHFRRLYFKLYP